jgi:anti-anti-sigma factor
VNDLANLFVWRREQVVVAGITGEVDVSNAQALLRAISGEVGAAARGLVLDLGGLDFMDSSGVHVLFELAARMHRRRLGFAIVLPPSSPPRRVLELSGPQPMDWAHATEEAAIAAVLAIA